LYHKFLWDYYEKVPVRRVKGLLDPGNPFLPGSKEDLDLAVWGAGKGKFGFDPKRGCLVELTIEGWLRSWGKTGPKGGKTNHGRGHKQKKGCLGKNLLRGGTLGHHLFGMEKFLGIFFPEKELRF